MKAQILKAIGNNKIFGVTFIKKDGTRRDMTCRTGVSKHLNPNSKGLTDNQKRSRQENNLLSVYDMVKKGYRTIPCDRIEEIRVGGMKIQIK